MVDIFLYFCCFFFSLLLGCVQRLEGHAAQGTKGDSYVLRVRDGGGSRSPPAPQEGLALTSLSDLLPASSLAWPLEEGMSCEEAVDSSLAWRVQVPGSMVSRYLVAGRLKKIDAPVDQKHRGETVVWADWVYMMRALGSRSIFPEGPLCAVDVFGGVVELTHDARVGLFGRREDSMTRDELNRCWSGLSKSARTDWLARKCWAQSAMVPYGVDPDMKTRLWAATYATRMMNRMGVC